MRPTTRAKHVLEHQGTFQYYLKVKILYNKQKHYLPSMAWIPVAALALWQAVLGMNCKHPERCTARPAVCRVQPLTFGRVWSD